MHVFWWAVLVLVVIHLRWAQVLVELSVVHFVPDCTSVRRWAWRVLGMALHRVSRLGISKITSTYQLADALGPAAGLLLVVQ